MLSKFIYKTLMVFALAFFAQVGFSQNYVSSDAAQSILKEEIAQFESSLDGKSTNAVATTLSSVNVSKVQLNMMQYILKGLAEEGSTVSQIMNSSYERANNVASEKRKAAKLDALNAIKLILS